jgi:dTDP-4-dehydrorhamnose reductase
MNTRTVIIGSGGRLGAALAREWTKAGDEIVGFAHRDLDIGNLEAVHSALDPLSFDVLVNCAALTAVDYCETHEEEAFRVNGDAVRVLGEICTRKAARCLHVSTDYVFDGEKKAPYAEEDPAHPISVYGASKRAGEIALEEISGEHLAVRISWVFGPDRPSFVDQIIQRARAHERVEAVADKWAVPTYTLDAAMLLRPFLRDVREGGLLHLCNSGGCTWQEYGRHALDCAAAAGIALKTSTVGAQRMSDLTAFIAKRPVHTVMSTAKLSRLTGLTARPWQEAVEAYVRDCVAAGV